MSKPFIIFCIGMFIWQSKGQSQSKFEIGLRADIYSIPVINPSVELGPGMHNIKARAKLNEAVYGEIIWWRKNLFGWYAGIGIHSYNYEAEYKITDPYIPNDFLIDEFRYIKSIGLGAKIGAIKQIKNTRFNLGLSVFDPFYYDESHKSKTITFIYFDPIEKPYVVRIAENINTVDDIGNYLMLQFVIQQKLSSNLFVNVGLESTVSTSRSHYELKITEYPQGGDPEANVVNNFFITAKYRAVTIGLAYYL